MDTHHGLLSLAPPLLAIGLALATRRLLPALGLAVLSGGLIAEWNTRAPLGSLGEGLFAGAGYAWAALTDVFNSQILLFVVLILAAISVILRAGGFQALVLHLARGAADARRAQLSTLAMGLLLFIDDYANTMVIGSAMRPLCDKLRVSREKLAFIIDATSAPVAGLALVSTWIGYEVGLFGELNSSLSLGSDGYSLFLDALPYRFYCWGMLAFLFSLLWWRIDFGPMARAERRAREEGRPFAEDARPLDSAAFRSVEPAPGLRLSAWTALLPIGSLLLVLFGGLWIDGGGLARGPAALFRPSAWFETLRASQNSISLLALGAGLALLLALLLAVGLARLPLGEGLRAMGRGLKGGLLPTGILVLAWALKSACEAVGTGPWLAESVTQFLSPLWFPALLFLLSGACAFATGTSWGTLAILLPTAIPLAWQLDGQVYGLCTMISLGAVLDGSILGDHCSPISDTTILSSISSGCDHLHHVRTQLPYSLFVGLCALAAGYLPAALDASPLLSLVGMGLCFFLLLAGLSRKAPRGVHVG